MVGKTIRIKQKKDNEIRVVRFMGLFSEGGMGIK